MLLILLTTVGLAMAGGPYSTTSPAPATSQPGLHSHYSLLHNLIVHWGYSDTCVATALEACNPISEQHQQPSLIQEAKEVLKEVSVMVNKFESRPRHCKDLLDSGDTGSGLRLVYPYPGQPHHHVTVFCDHTVDGGGWTVFQRRTNDSIRQDFNRTWIEYQLGFGNIETEFWMGLDLLHVLTSTTLHELRIDLADYEGGERWAMYGFFNVGSDETKYRLSIGRYSGDAGDAMQVHHGHSFSTHDQDNDAYEHNCAELRRGAWWYTDCGTSNLNGYQHQGATSPGSSGYIESIFWKQWLGWYYSLNRTSMMIRPAF
ncbi:Fibrinogen C domain-containing protein 1 [Chionoecetes opilio]|uniref:Fibrinogen C domain-containing protein 1 n=1 Tax=Chionoecetes opilio TaxID=41210 RepID=A0A8J4XNB7_CHIOP|nr:Fibrinogen C domain-containing protein 1 [Chionoecetes opilio]